MRVAGIEQVGIGTHNARCNPRQMPAAIPLAGAGGDDRLKVAVKRDGVVVLAHLSAQSLCDVQLIEEENGTKGW